MARAPVSKTGGCRFEVLPLLPIKSITSRQASENKVDLDPIFGPKLFSVSQDRF